MRLPEDDISDIKQEKEEKTVENNQDVKEPVSSDVLLDIGL